MIRALAIGLVLVVAAPSGGAEDFETPILETAFIMGNLADDGSRAHVELRGHLNAEQVARGVANDLVLVDIDGNVCQDASLFQTATSHSFYHAIDRTRSRTVFGDERRHLDLEVERNGQWVRLLRLESDGEALAPGLYADRESALQIDRLQRDEEGVLHVDLRFRQNVDGTTQFGWLRLNVDPLGGLAENAIPELASPCAMGFTGPAGAPREGGVVVPTGLLEHLRGVENGFWDPEPPKSAEQAIEDIEQDRAHLAEQERKRLARQQAEDRRKRDDGAPLGVARNPAPQTREPAPEAERFFGGGGGGGGPSPRARSSSTTGGRGAARSPGSRPAPSSSDVSDVGATSARRPAERIRTQRAPTLPTRPRAERARRDTLHSEAPRAPGRARPAPTPVPTAIDATAAEAKTDTTALVPTNARTHPSIRSLARTTPGEPVAGEPATAATPTTPRLSAPPSAAAFTWFDDTLDELARFLSDAVAWLTGDPA